MATYGQSVGSRTAPAYRGTTVVAGRQPRTNDRFRRCQVDECGTVLSRYNLAETCRIHTPIRFPRVRGHVPRSVPSWLSGDEGDDPVPGVE